MNEVRTTQYVSKIQNMDWSFLDSFSDCQSYFSNFIKVFKKIYEESFPLIRVKIRYRNRLPWLSDGLKASIKHKNKLYLLSLKHPTLYNISKYKQYRNKLHSLLKTEEKHFYQSQIVQNKNNLRKVWQSGLNNSIGPIARDCPKWPSGNCICVRSCPPNLCGWIFGQPIFFLYQTTAQYPLTMVLQKILYWTTSMLILSMISYPLYSIYCILGSYHHCTGPVSGILMTKFEKHYSISNG